MSTMHHRTKHTRRGQNVGWKPDSTPAPEPDVTPDDEWLRRACKLLRGHWIITQHHKARFAWCADRPVTAWTDGTRKLAWNAVLQYPTLWAELNIIPRPMPAPIAASATAIPAHSGRIDADSTHFTTPTQLDAFVLIALQSVGFRWLKDRACYALRIEPLAADAVAKLGAEYGFTLDPTADKAIAAMHEQTATLSALSNATTGEFAVSGLAVTPYPYQQAGIRYLVETKKALLCDDMGLGKTLQSLAAVQSLGAWPCIVVTLPIVKDGWKREAQQWLPGVEVIVWSGKTDAPTVFPGEAANKPSTLNPQLSTPRTLHIINYDILSARLEELKEIGAQSIIFDEAHKCNNGKSARAKAAKALAARKPVRFGLTGTPSENEPKEILSLIGLVGRIDSFGGFGKFVTRYLAAKKGTYGWDFGGAQHLDELHRTLRATCFLRRRKEQVQRELPERIVTRVPIELSAIGIANYNAAAADVKAWLAQKAPYKPEFLRSIAHLPDDVQEFEKAKEYAAAIERIDGMELLHRFGVLRRAVLAAKLPAAVEWLLHHAEGEKMVLFGHHKSGLRELLPQLAPLMPLLIDGEVPTTSRSAIVERFKRPEHRLLLANFDAAGTGLDGLQRAASHCTFLEWPWTPSKVRQCVSRLHRNGQKSTVHEWHHIATGTIDEDSLALLDEKATTADLIADGTSNPQQEAFTRARKLAAKL